MNNVNRSLLFLALQGKINALLIISMNFQLIYEVDEKKAKYFIRHRIIRYYFKDMLLYLVRRYGCIYSFK